MITASAGRLSRTFHTTFGWFVAVGFCAVVSKNYAVPIIRSDFAV